MFRFVDIIKTYQLGTSVVHALKDVSGELPAGQMTALVGPSGSGKSTLLQICGLIDNVDSGELHFGGVRIDLLNDRAKSRLRQRSFGFVFQSYHLIPTLTLLENVMLPRLLAGETGAAVKKRANMLLDRVGLAKEGDRNIRALSGGQRQRVAIARALINAPEVIFADEPTANLDSLASAAVVKLLTEACREDGVTLVMATHNAAIADLAHQVIHLNDGKSR
jgi:putative ABC transport system ATP-binding protein